MKRYLRAHMRALAVLVVLGVATAAYAAITLTKFNVSIAVDGVLTNPQNLSTPADKLSLTKRFAFTDGEGASQAERMWSSTRTLAGGAADSLDLYGTLTSAFGETINVKKIRGVIIYHDTPDANDVLEIGGDPNAPVPLFATTPVTDPNSVPYFPLTPGGAFLVISKSATGWAVTTSTADILRVKNDAGGSITYRIIILYTV